ncbi:MAG: aspartate carbamoyltransferase catalytic subunit [Alphaproteobacteria bacterium]|nr:aspartate carbamoyltransferase catalytic subunit [Alphaproteobacteria bacterium]MBP7759021.1 aspartate carbamoyltransferase catalytic subunit [Alphaproteobacteria bacterium]MBP7762295.1 aspartate carbamoyltransferase catalytic subunit [Alphaproteobacteria bacterium]MBP7905472.1 aspartate carbamoyltransferase catalytic subunit [Alphaproteobacteria bacterium]
MKHLLGIAELSAEEIRNILDRADYYSDALVNGKWDRTKLENKIVLTMFFETSTRTVTSFDMAAKRLGADVVNWNAEYSSLKKDETFTDTIDTLGAMEPDAIVIRHYEYGAPGFVASRVKCPVINAGDSWREHPTQALLDALTMEQEKGKLEGLEVAICGDVAHSRVANSNILLLSKMGAKVRIVAPEILMPEKLPVEGIPKFTRLEEGIEGADIVMMLRIQKERMERSLIPDDAAFFRQYGLTAERLKHAKKDALVMHPGPMNRGLEIADDVADDPERSLLKKQVANGIPTRMAVLDLLLSE